MRIHVFRLFAAGFVLSLSACTKSLQESPLSIEESQAVTMVAPSQAARIQNNQGAKLEMYKAEYITSGEGNQAGQTVYFKNVGNKKLADDFVPGDPRRGGHNNITYLVDDETTSDNGLTSADVNGAIDNAMGTWDAVTCSNLNIEKIPFTGDLGFVQAILGYGGSFDFFADIQHSGFLPAGFFDFLAPGGSNFILGVTFTIIFIDDDGNPTDIDHNGRIDVAFREIYYNDNFSWRTDGGHYDIETIALHESGHGLSQAHFGTAFRNSGNDKLHFAPRAVMNAAYGGVLRNLLGTDNAGHCSNWASWPNR